MGRVPIYLAFAFGGIALATSKPELEYIVTAAVINEMIAVIDAKKGFELAGETV